MNHRTKRCRLASIWPSDQEKLLLQAALFQGEVGHNAAHRWQAVWMENGLVKQSKRLLPLLHQNLKKQSIAIDASLATLLKQSYIQTWGMNKLLFHSLAEILHLFQDADIPTLLLKGSALTPAYYDNDYGLRPMNDVDILIPVKQVKQAMMLLSQQGWNAEQRGEARFNEDSITILHSHPFRKPRGYQCDLHWHILPECCRCEDDTDFWHDSQSIEVAGISTRILNPADQLLHLCLHGARWNHCRSVHWLADVMIVLKTEKIDWQRLIHQVRKRHLIVPVRETLHYLSRHFDAPIPPDVLQQLIAASSSRMEQWEYDYQLADHDQKPFGYLPILWFRYRRWVGAVQPWRQLIGFPDYLRRYWGADNYHEFFRILVTMVRRRLRRF